MSFFDDPVPPAPPPDDEHPEFAPPPWWGAPSNVIPGVAPVEVLLARSDKAAVALGGMWAFPTGLKFTLYVRTRDLDRAEERLMHRTLMGRHELDDELRPDPDGLRFGVLFADGAKVTTLDDQPFGLDSEPERPVLHQGGGGGGSGAFEWDFWLWPLPPPGPLVFVCAWPALAVPETGVELDAAPLREAAGRAVTLWPDNRRG